MLLTAPQALKKYGTTLNGLTDHDVAIRQKLYGPNLIGKKQSNLTRIFFRQFTSNPLIIILIVATLVSYTLGQHVSAYYIFVMIFAGILLGFWNEYAAEKTIAHLLKKISLSTLVVRNGIKQEIPVAQLTIGDLVLLSPGSIAPADLELIEIHHLEMNESALTGESKTVSKHMASANLIYMGTSVVSGFGRGAVIKIGKDTAFGKIAKSTTFLKPTTEFQKGLAQFGQLIIKVVLILTLAIFSVNFLLGHQFLESILFALAIAVGLTPELLPVIVTVCLSHGAGRLAKNHVVAKRLLAIENLGNMDILCTDKTGTLTEGRIKVVDYFDQGNKKNVEVLHRALACNNALVHHKIVGDPIDTALWQFARENHFTPDKKLVRVDEEPFDYQRKAMFVATADHQEITLIAKGAPDTILGFCQLKNKEEWRKKFQELNRNGLRVICLATKSVPQKNYSWDDLTEMNFSGYITFLDTPKESVREALTRLHHLNVEIKVITGDNEIITKKICQEVGMATDHLALGNDLEKLSGTALEKKVVETKIFARVNPEQKLKIIQTLQRLGHAVGYLGDGINDVPALYGADAGISVNTAVDVAKDAASVVLLRKNLHVLADGIIEGRKTFNNTIKYILMGTSSNFGNMFSAAGASFFLPFLPMTPAQILLTNGLYDVSQLSIPSDNVDAESLLKPRHWQIGFIKNYMLFFGPLSSVYDFLTFGILFYFFRARGPLFQTGWFVESLATQILVVFVIRTARTPFFKSRPSRWLFFTCLSISVLALILPYTKLAAALGFVPLPPLYFVILILLVATYLLLVEVVKNKFLQKYQF